MGCSVGFTSSWMRYCSIAMAGTSEVVECPVLAAWGTSEIVLKRLLEKNLLVLEGARLSRGTVLANRDFLIPLINLVGSWYANYAYIRVMH